MEYYKISSGQKSCPELLGGTPKSRTKQDIPIAITKILNKSCTDTNGKNGDSQGGAAASGK